MTLGRIHKIKHFQPDTTREKRGHGSNRNNGNNEVASSCLQIKGKVRAGPGSETVKSRPGSDSPVDENWPELSNVYIHV